MTATNVCTRHARETNRKRHTLRRPKATNDTSKANKVEAAKPPPALAVAPDGAGNDGTPSGTGANAAPAPEPADAAAADPASQAERAGADSQGAEPTPTTPGGPG